MVSIIILVIILLILIIFFEDKLGKKTYFNAIKVKKSPIGGNGVFARKNFNIDDVIEIAPVLKENAENFKGLLNDYIFSISDEEKEKGIFAFALGYGGLYNHCDNNNANWKIDGDYLIVTATRPIKKGEEILVSYGQDYWDTRDYVKN